MSDVLDFIQRHWGILMSVASGGAMTFWLSMDSKYAKKSDVSALRESIEENDDRLTKIETKVDNLPTAQDFAQLQILMTQIQGETKATNTSVKAISHQVGLLLEDKVLNKKD